MSLSSGPVPSRTVLAGFVLLGGALGSVEVGVSAVVELFLTALFAALYLAVPVVVISGLMVASFRLNSWLK